MPHPLDPECVEEVDWIGIVTVHDGPSLAPGEIIAPGRRHRSGRTSTITTTSRIPRRFSPAAAVAAGSTFR